MRWKVNTNPKVGDTRVISRFFFFPQRFGDMWIWWERSKVYQRRIETYTYEFGMAIPHGKWADIAIVNK